MKRILTLICLLCLLTVCLTGCGSGSALRANEGYDTADEFGLYTNDENATNKTEGNNSESKELKESSRKLIKNYSVTMNTKTFDDLYNTIESETTNYAGYIQSSTNSGTEYRNADITVRIPSKNTDAFLASISKKGTVTYKNVTTQDVTLSYADTAAHLEALRAEQKKLMEFMESASNMSDLITIQDRITSISYEIESYESQLRTMDNMIDYDTIAISIQEVEVEITAEKQSVWSEIGQNLKYAFHNIGQFFRGAFVVFVSSIPYLLVLAGFIIVILLIVKFIIHKQNKKIEKKKQDENVKL